MSRFLAYYSTNRIWRLGNSTDNSTEFDSNLQPVEDVSVDIVISSLFFNTIVFVFLMAFYECLRYCQPEVYSSRKRKDHTRPERGESSVEIGDNTQNQYVPPCRERLGTGSEGSSRSSKMPPLPDDKPLDWIGPVFGVPWSKVRKAAGLDGYFFLRYIRMNVRITAVSTFWFCAILVPVYATGNGNTIHPVQGWYHLSATNLSSEGWRKWVPCVFAYLFSAFIAFVIKQEYRHFLELRQDFLARGTAHVNPQHHYSLMVENIPFELRSERALQEYFESLFPGKVHSASVVLNLPDLEDASNRCMRSCRRLEKSIATLHATGKRPTHVTGQARLRLLGIDLAPLDCRQCNGSLDTVVVESDHLAERPTRGTRVDSISYYTQELAAHSRELFRIQSKKKAIASSGNVSIRADNWFDKAVKEVSAVASRIMDDSYVDNDLLSPSESSDYADMHFVQAEYMSSMYGSFSPAALAGRSENNSGRSQTSKYQDREAPLVNRREVSVALYC